MPSLLAAIGSANGHGLIDIRCSAMPPDLIPKSNNRALPFSLGFVSALLDLFCSALLAAAQSGTHVPYFSPWLTLSNATVLCAKIDLGLCAYPLLPVPWKHFYRFVSIHDGYFRDNSLARGRGRGFYAYSNEGRVFCSLPRCILPFR